MFMVRENFNPPLITVNKAAKVIYEIKFEKLLHNHNNKNYLFGLTKMKLKQKAQ